MFAFIFSCRIRFGLVDLFGLLLLFFVPRVEKLLASLITPYNNTLHHITHR